MGKKILQLAENCFAKLDFENAIKHLNTGLLLQPNNLKLQNHLAYALIHLGRDNEAIEILERVCKQNQKQPEALNNLGNLYTKIGKNAEALSLFNKAIMLKPNFPDVYNNMAVVFKNLYQYAESKQALNKCLKYAPKHLLALTNMGKLSIKNGNYEHALHCFNKALQVNPNWVDALCGIAEIYRLQDKYEDAIIILQKLFVLSQRHVDGHLTMGLIYKKQEDYANAIKHFIIADTCNTKPSILILSHLIYCYLQIFAWEQADKIKTRLNKAVTDNAYIDEAPPFEACMAITDVLQQQKLTEKWCANVALTIEKHKFYFAESSNEKIRIGYISPNFSKHPVGFLLNTLLTKHDRKEFEIFAFATRYNEDTYFHLIKNSVDHFIMVDQMSDLEVAKIIHQNKIDILVDLDGHTDRDNIGILAYQPAKIQCHWLGYTGTIGAKFVQYQIADPNLVPDELANSYTESILRLPYVYAIDTFPKNDNCSIKRTDYGLPEGAFVFCYLSRAYRIDKEVFIAWMQILQAVPNSVLWLSLNFNEQRRKICNLATNLGVESKRIIFSNAFNLSINYAHTLSDLWLDSFNYTSGTSGLLCLFGQVPILSLAGKAPQAKISTFYLKASGLQELIAVDRNDYIQKAILLATDKNYYRQIKNKIIQSKQHTDLYNAEKFINNLEKGYKKILDNYHNKIQMKIVDIFN